MSTPPLAACRSPGGCGVGGSQLLSGICVPNRVGVLAIGTSTPVNHSPKSLPCSASQSLVPTRQRGTSDILLHLHHRTAWWLCNWWCKFSERRHTYAKKEEEKLTVTAWLLNYYFFSKSFAFDCNVHAWTIWKLVVKALWIKIWI